MEKYKLQERLESAIIERTRIYIIHKQEYAGITRLKKELRRELGKNSGLHKRQYGYYSHEIDIFIISTKTEEKMWIYGRRFDINCNEDAEMMCNLLLPIVKKSCKRQICYEVNKGIVSERNESVYNIIRHNKRVSIPRKYYLSKNEAIKEALSYLDSQIEKSRKLIQEYEEQKQQLMKEKLL